MKRSSKTLIFFLLAGALLFSLPMLSSGGQTAAAAAGKTTDLTPDDTHEDITWELIQLRGILSERPGEPGLPSGR